jgi:hypothetical protein
LNGKFGIRNWEFGIRNWELKKVTRASVATKVSKASKASN